MDTVHAVPPMPARRGLPIDPVLQLYGGQLTPSQTLTIGPTLTARATIPNPARVAVYIYPRQVALAFSIGISGVTTPAYTGQVYDGRPLVLHCRDYPGLVQSELWVGGSMGDVFVVQEYVLQPWW